jgi:hypothetical protein
VGRKGRGRGYRCWESGKEVAGGGVVGWSGGWAVGRARLESSSWRRRFILLAADTMVAHLRHSTIRILALAVARFGFRKQKW